MTCKNCIHDEVCNIHGYIDADECACFKNKADFVEVKHGEWGYGRSMHKKVCLRCGTEMPFKKKGTYHIVWYSNYCPECGAEMKIKEN